MNFLRFVFDTSQSFQDTNNKFQVTPGFFSFSSFLATLNGFSLHSLAFTSIKGEKREWIPFSFL